MQKAERIVTQRREKPVEFYGLSGTRKNKK